MSYLVAASLGLPLVGCVLVYLLGSRREKTTSQVVRLFTTLIVCTVTALVVLWVKEGAEALEWDLGILYESPRYHFPLFVYLDSIGIVFLATTAYLTAIIVRFSRYYMHRESGYARFFSTIFLFLFGMNVLVFAGTIDLLFAGWEIVGISSFLLVAFYRERSTPVRNALVVYAVYRVCDVGVLLGAWMAHTIWHEVQNFSELASAVATASPETGSALTFMSFLILLAACGKSGQFPFSFWVPRAMEGPTPSSAIFYGAISIHCGVFLLLRMYPLWHSIPVAVWVTGMVGAVTVVLSTLSGRAQSNIKGQIGYASVTQVGLMLIELAIGFPKLALIHFVANAGLRCYQLLVSPSVVVQILRMQSSAGSDLTLSEWSTERWLPNRLRTSLYALAFNEGYLLEGVRLLCVLPLRATGELVHRVDKTGGRIIGVVLAVGFVFVAASGLSAIWLGGLAAGLMVLASLSAFAESKSAVRAWNAVGFSCLFAGIAVFLMDGQWSKDFALYFSGVVPPWFVGLFLVRYFSKSMDFARAEFHGKVREDSFAALLLFLCVLGLAGFPIGPSFVGEDALLFHSVGNSVWLAGILTFGFVVNGITLARLFSKICFGPELPAEADVAIR
ncbi:MAG: NADH-quinone oxidoreductase subunit E [Bdellovibrionaceae bacterium]|nr:hypothetical protein [Bdellovibrionales bacterium]MCB9253539.1 NADH-quinone oxidoreductase subunit E [Pseudobdellovibrionaceae bacterium]